MNRWRVEVARLERDYFGQLVEQCKGSHAAIARASGLPRQSVRHILERTGLIERCNELRPNRWSKT